MDSAPSASSQEHSMEGHPAVTSPTSTAPTESRDFSFRTETKVGAISPHTNVKQSIFNVFTSI